MARIALPVRDGWRRYSYAALLAGAMVLVVSCTGDSDVNTDELGDMLRHDGSSLVDLIQENDDRVGELIGENITHDASTDEQCGNDGVRRMWSTEFSLETAGDPTDPQQVNTVYNGYADFLGMRFRELGYAATTPPHGDGLDSRQGQYERAVDEQDVTLTFVVTYGLTADQPGDVVTTDVTIEGVTPCFE
ncbi:hypothetical protein [Phytoactinopolyspora limicola]|uniref:hypothetical protein n=1 Tax=Phytoactinopolyspora limicola TaxID=2715536 RepID=UPI0014092806|nr:hypothetical protein [Phytoactinopolyspora limicola]